MKTVEEFSHRVRLWTCGLAAVVLVSCGGSSQIRTIAAPANAVNLAPFGADFAVLAGAPDARGVFLIDASNGNVRSSFGVTGEADAISAVTNGPVLLGIASVSSGRSIGAIEFWSASGKKIRVLPVSDAVADLTEPVGNRLFALVGTRSVRTAVEIDLTQERIARIMPLPSAIDHLSACEVKGETYLLEASTSERKLIVRNVDRGSASIIDEEGSDIVCAPKTYALYGLVETFGSKNLIVQTFPMGFAVTELPASVDALAVRVLPSGDDVAILNTAGDRSSIDLVAAPTAPPSSPPRT